MLRKPEKIKIDPEKPFENDGLLRSENIGLLTNLIKSTNQPFVLSVEAPWGWGKTTFIEMWKAHLQNNGHACFYFNAWENDFIDDPLIAFLGEINKFIKTETEQTKTEAKESLDKVMRIGAGVLRKTLPLAIQIATHGLLKSEVIEQAAQNIGDDADAIADFASTLAKERLEKYETEKEGIKEFRSNLEILTQQIIKKEGRATPLVFFIDEMDRCRPDFAIALLERIKHLFNVERIVFVLAVDRNQLNQSVKALYGTDNPDGYLRRFIDLAYLLPSPDIDEFASGLFYKFNLHECIPQLGGHEALFLSFSGYAKAFGLSLRIQEQCFTEINIALRTAPGLSEHLEALAFLVTFRAHKPNVFRDVKEGRTTVQSMMAALAQMGLSQGRLRNWAEASIVCGLLDEENRNNHIDKLQREAANTSAPTHKMFLEVLNNIKRLKFNYSFSNAAERMVSALEITNQFR